LIGDDNNRYRKTVALRELTAWGRVLFALRAGYPYYDVGDSMWKFRLYRWHPFAWLTLIFSLVSVLVSGMLRGFVEDYVPFLRDVFPQNGEDEYNYFKARPK